MASKRSFRKIFVPTCAALGALTGVVALTLDSTGVSGSISFILSSLSLWMLHDEKPERLQLYLTQVAAGLVMALSVRDLLGHGAMGPLTAVNFALLASALFVATIGPWKLARVAQLLAAIAFLTSFQSIVADWFGISDHLGVVAHNQMELPTAFMLMLLSCGILLSRADRGLMAVFSEQDTSGFWARRFILAALLVPPSVNWLELMGRHIGWYDAEIGTLLRSLGNITFFTLVVWRSAVAIHRFDLARRLADEQRRKSLDEKGHLQSILDSAFDAILCMDSQSIITEWNPRAEAIFGWNKKAALGKRMSDLIIPERFRERGLEQLLETGEAQMFNQSLDVIALHRDGHEFPVQMSISAFKSANHLYFTAFIADITERKKAEHQLKLRSQQLSEAQAIAHIGNWSWDMRTQVLTWSDEMYRIHGFEPNEVQPSFDLLRSLVHPEDLELLDQHIDFAFQDHDTYSLDYRIIRRDGSLRYLNGHGQALYDADGHPTDFVGTAQDITDIRLATNEIRKLNSELERRVTQRTKQLEESLQERAKLLLAEHAARQASEMKSSFLANMSHEIRTPINGVIGMAGLLIDTNLNETQKDYALSIKRSADNLLTIINDILDFSKVEAGKLELETVHFSLRDVITDCTRTMQHSATEKKVRLVTDILDNVPDTLLGDPGRLGQILLNLISNAIKFTQKGRVMLRARCIDSDQNAVLRFEVEDSGVGIPPETLKRLFQPFSQGDASTSRKYGGTGLGLSICKRLVDLMHGRIGVESEIGHGSTFWFEIPLQEGSKSSIPIKHALRSSTSEANSHVRILIAEDNMINQKIALKMVEKMGYQANAVANGAEVLKALADVPYDLILMDCQMPEVDGFEATRLIRESQTLRNPKIPIIAMTANALKGDRERCLDAGMNDYVSKPVSQEALQGAIEKWLAQQKAA